MKAVRLYIIVCMKLTVCPKLRVTFSLVLILFLSACALNNQIVIDSKNDYQRTFVVDGFEFIFPPKSNIHFSPLHGAAWVLSGDIMGISQDVVSQFEHRQGLLPPERAGSQLNIREITINYGDRRIDGTVSDMGVRLSMKYDGKYDGHFIESCDSVEVIPPHQPPVHHGLFATRDKMRTMIQPVFEKLIANALDEAIFLSLVCLSQEAISQAQE